MPALFRWMGAALLAGVLLCAGCDGDDDDGPPVDVAGTWSLTQAFSSGNGVTFNVTFAQNGGTLTGTSKYGPVNGSVSGSSIIFTIQDEDLKTFSGKVSGANMSGTFTENFENDLFRDGQWVANKT